MTATTVHNLVYKIVEIYEKHVYCEGFPNKKTQDAFEKEAYAFIQEVFSPKLLDVDIVE